MSDRLTFSLASLILIFVAGFALLIPGTAEADSVTVPDVANQTWDTTAAITNVTLGEATHTGDTAFTYSLSPTLPAGIKFDAATRVLSGTATKGMKLTTYTYTATGNTTSHVGSVDFTIEVQTSPTFADAYNDNTATERLKLGYKAGTGNRIINLPVATDEDGDPLTYTLAGTPPTGFAFDAGNPGLGTLPSIYGSADTVPDPASAELTYTATDNDNNAVTLYLTFTVEADLKPMLAVISNITATVDTAIKNVQLPLVPAANINAGETITYALTPALPAGLSYSEILLGTWVLGGTPTEAAAEAEYVWTATDPDGDKAESKFKITVNAIPVAVSFGGSSIGDKTFTVGTYTESLLPSAQQGTGVGNLTYSLTPQVPAGLTFANRVLSGTPTTAAAAVEYTYKVEDSADPKTSATLTFNITVNAEDGTTPTDPTDNTPPTVTITGAPTAAITAATEVTLTFNEALKADPTVTGDPAGTAAMYTATVAAATAANTYTVTITPTAAANLTADVAETDVTFTVAAMDTNDNSLAAGNTFDVTLAARTAPVTSENNPPRFDAGVSIADIELWTGQEYKSGALPLASDDVGDSITYTFSPDLPEGLRYTQQDQNNYFIEGKPTAMMAKTAYKYTASDQHSAMVSLDFSITVKAPIVPTAPTLVSAMENRPENNNKIVATWTGPTGEFGSAITNYVVYVTPVGGSEMSYKTPDATTMTFTTPMAMNTGMYDVQVAAENGVGIGAKSAKRTVVVSDVPGKPTNLRRSDTDQTNAGTIRLVWTAPVDDGGSPVTNYVIYQTTDGVSKRPVSTTTTNVTYDVGGLQTGSHVFHVSAVNADGEGMKSDPYTHTRPVDPDNKPPTFEGRTIASIAVTVGQTIDVTLPEASDPEQEALTYSLTQKNRASENLPSGVTFTSSTRKLAGTTTAAMASRSYIYTATDSGGASISLEFSIEVASAAPPAKPATAIIDSTISLPSATIPPNGFIVLQRNGDDSGIYSQVNSVEVGLANLDHLFRDRGGIALIGPGAAKDLVFSEIMWGSDSSLADDTHSQWIELYNTTKTSLQLSNYMLEFYSARVGATPNAIDEVNSLGWGSLHGQRGRTSGVDTQGVHAQPVEIISMYRKINYAQVKNHEKREEQLKAVPGGSGHGSWAASTRPSLNIAATWRLATPGAQPRFTIHGATSVPRGVTISEIGNSSTDAYDWFELYNTTDGEINLKKWQLSRVTDNAGKGKEDAVLKFPDNDAIKIPAKSYLVIAASNPKNAGNDLAAGIDITKSAVNQSPRGLGERGNSAVANYAVLGFSLPNDTKKSLFILRNGHGNLGKAAGIQDVIGTLSIKLQGPVVSGWTGHEAHNEIYYNTSLWPLHATGGPHGNVIDGGDEDFRAGKVYQRNNFGGGTGEKHLAVRGYTGIGYDRHADANAENGGTPGYSKDALKGDKSNWANQVTISEIMLGIEEGEGPTRVPRATRLPQWFEIYNNSLTEGVSLNNWYLEIQNTAEELDGFEYKGNLHATLRLPNMNIQPNQTVVIVSSSGLNSGHFPEQRTINLFTNGTYRNELGIRGRGEPVLNPKGFYIQLRDHKNTHVDEAGNLGLSHRAGRTGVGRRDEDVDTWDISLDDLIAADGHRTSLIRIYDNKDRPRNGLNKIGGPMDQGSSWIRASGTSFRNVPSLTFFGNHRDYGTPGYRGGGPLPVSLSKFRPERLKDTGEVVIRWITESELNNAGFNILRSEKRDGEFTKVHFVAGQGTTTERTSYEWKDTSAKPNVVYYYQIQDVSLDGEVQTLRLSRLKGNVTSAGKATTTWGEIKALQ